MVDNAAKSDFSRLERNQNMDLKKLVIWAAVGALATAGWAA